MTYSFMRGLCTPDVHIVDRRTCQVSILGCLRQET